MPNKPKNLKKYRNLAFILALLIGFSYFFLLTRGVSAIFSGFFMQLLFLAEFIKNPQSNISVLVLSLDFLLHISAGLVLLYLLFTLTKGSIKSAYLLFKTKHYIKSLKIIKSTPDFQVFDSFLL